MLILENKKGIVLISTYLVIVVLTIISTTFLSRSLHESRFSEREAYRIQALYLAEAGMEEARQELYDAFSTYYDANGKLSSLFVWFDTLTGVNPPYSPPPVNSRLDQSYTVQISSVTAVDGQADVTIRSSGTVNNVTTTIESVIRYGLAPSRVFNYAYFINNFGWFYGGGIHANGDVRSNGNFALRGNPTVNGDIYASVNPALGADGSITGNSQWDTISWYRNHSGTRARPTNPPFDPTPGEDPYDYEAGYDGNSTRLEHQDILPMPYLGDLRYYRNLALSKGGTIKQGGVTLVDAVYDGPGPDGVEGTPDDGCMVLIGTAANPIEINGPVVVNRDVIIRGVVSGQGSIYSGRNTHIVGNITYADPPAWPKPDTDPEGTAVINKQKDFIGLATKGNVIVGDYTRNDWRRTVRDYLRSPFTQPYAVDISDSSNGYVSYYIGGEPYFDGNYTADDGGQKDNGRGGAANRRYYESSLADSYIHNIATPSNQIRQIDAVTYTNHAWAGRVGSFTVNGTIVARDEAIIYSGSIKLTYDVRAYNGGIEEIDIYLPRELAVPEVLSWDEQ